MNDKLTTAWAYVVAALIYNEEYARKICLMCETWAEGYRKKNKEQTNLFAQE